MKKLCEVFNVSLDELVGKEKPVEEQEEPKVVETKTICGYCEKCKKPVSYGEYKVSHLLYVRSNDSVVADSGQHIYCNSCYNSVLAGKSATDKKKAQQKADFQRKEGKTAIKKGLIWGAVVAAIACAVLLAAYFYFPSSITLVSAIVGTLGAFGLTACMFWDCWLADFFSFFCRSFSAPFGFIFELSLDGILWLITVKLALWLLCGALSIGFFLLGLFLSICLGAVGFPFTLWYFLAHPEKLNA
jgi:hypothetical protein